MSNTDILSLPVAVGITGSEWTPLVQGNTTKRAQTGLIGRAGTSSSLPAALEWTIDGGGSTVSSRIWGTLTVPFDAQITGASMQADQIGSVIVDIWKCTFAQYDPPTTPTASNSITGGSPPTISSASKVEASIAAWTTTLAEGDILTFYVPSVATNITRVTLTLSLTRIVSS